MRNVRAKTLPCLICAMFAALVFAGCDMLAPASAATPLPTDTPVIVQFELTEQAQEAAAATMPAPTPSPTPDQTPVPFSYYAPTVNMTFEELVGGTSDFGEMGSSKVNWPKGYPPADTYKIIVDVYWQVTMVFSKDANGEYTVPVRYMLCSTGNPRIEDGGETRRGTFNMLVPRIRFGHFLSGEAAQYWSLIHSRTYFHSVLYDKQDKLSTYQIETYEQLGTKASHGCIRLTVPDARWIWYNIAYGTVCEIRDGSKDDTVTQRIREQLVLPVAPTARLKIVAGQTPYTDNWTIDSLLAAFDASTILPFKNEKQPVPKLESDDEEETASPSPGADGSTGTTPEPGAEVTPAPSETATPTPVPTSTPEFATGTS